MRYALSWLVLCALAGCQCGTMGGAPPTVFILSPRDGETIAPPAVLSGQANDPEDGLLTGDALIWSSDRDGAFAQGAQVVANLSEGPHRLTLTATDSAGNPGQAQISITVRATNTVNRPPTAVISAPLNGAVFDEGTAIELTGTGADPEDGALQGAALTWSSSVGGLLGTGAALTFNGAALGTHRILLTAADSQGLSAIASIEIEVVRPGTNRAPMVNITAPANNSSVVLGQAAMLSGTATDQEDGVLTGASLTWRSSRDGVLGTGAALSPMLTQGVHTLTLTALDSMGASGVASITVSVNQAGNQPPTVTITQPAPAQTIFQGSSVTLSATATDAEDGTLTGMALAWSSSLDGPLGTGSPLLTTTLTAGTHALSCIVTDSGGNTGSATVSLTVLPMNTAPVVNFSMPGAGASFAAGAAVTLVGSANDAEDGVLTGSALTWRSSLDGVLGTGSPLSTSSLRVGSHVLSLTATDSGGRTSSATVNVTITMSTGNLAPIARLTGPTSGMATQGLSFSGATSSDSDGSITSYAFNWGDGSPVTTGAAANAMHPYAATGTYTVTLTVTDNLGATGTSTLQVVISPFVRTPSVVDEQEPYGVACSLAAQGTLLHVAYFATMHPGVYYSTWNGTTFTRELVDGLGFNMGGRADGRLAMAVDAQGAPHVLWVRAERSELWYAKRVNGAWQRERVDTNVLRIAGTTLGLTIDAANGEPVVTFPYSPTSGQLRTVIGRRTGGAWVLATPRFTTATSTEAPTGDVTVVAGTVYVPFTASVAPNTGLGALSGATASTLPLSFSGTTRLEGVTGKLFLMSSVGLHDVVIDLVFANSVTRLSLVQASSTNQQSVALDGSGRPRVITNRSGVLESVTPRASDDYWTYENLGATDSGLVDVAVDGAGDTRACFFRAGRLLLY